MKTSRLIPFVVLPLLFACVPKKPEIPMTEVPAGPLLQELEQRGRSFSSLKAMASIQAARKDRKRSFESVGILLKGQEKFRIEAYAPFGQTLMTLLWNGNEIFLDLSGKHRVIPAKSGALERMLGTEIDPSELCAVLAGNIPGPIAGAHVRFLCAQNGKCVLELKRDNALIRAYPDPGADTTELRISSYEVFRDGNLSYRVKFSSFERVSGYSLPKSILIENPDKRMSLNVEYSDADVNVPLDAGSFTLPWAEGTDW